MRLINSNNPSFGRFLGNLDIHISDRNPSRFSHNVPICSPTRFDTKGVGGMSKNLGCRVVLRTYGKSGSREIWPAAAFPGLFRGKSSMSVAAIVDRPFRLRIQKSSFISLSLPLPRWKRQFQNSQRTIFFTISLSLSFLPHHFSGNRLCLSLLALSQAYKIAAGKAQVEGDAAQGRDGERRRCFHIQISAELRDG